MEPRSRHRATVMPKWAGRRHLGAHRPPVTLSTSSVYDYVPEMDRMASKSRVDRIRLALSKCHPDECGFMLRFSYLNRRNREIEIIAFYLRTPTRFDPANVIVSCFRVNKHIYCIYRAR